MGCGIGGPRKFVKAKRNAKISVVGERELMQRGGDATNKAGDGSGPMNIHDNILTVKVAEVASMLPREKQ